MESSPTFRITTYYKLPRGEPGIRQLGSKRLNVLQALDWVLNGLPEDALTVEYPEGEIVVRIDVAKVGWVLQ
jgi:hypothetical protein